MASKRTRVPSNYPTGLPWDGGVSASAMAARKRRHVEPLDEESAEHALYTPDFAERVNQRAKEPAGFFSRDADDSEDGEPGNLFDRG